MKNVKLGVFVVGTTLMLWLGCSNYTWDPQKNVKVDPTSLETIYAEEDSLISETAGTFDELDE